MARFLQQEGSKLMKSPLAAAMLLIATPAMAECGIASTYGSPQPTASGERFNPGAMTAAHKSLPMGSRVTVRNMRTGRAVTVRINDRGPFVAGRIIDLSTRAMSALGGGGLARVCISR